MLAFKNTTLRRSNHVLFSDSSFTLFQGQKIGLTGENGSGKSSIFLLLLKQLEVDKGEVFLPSDKVIAFVEQEIQHQQLSALEYVLTGDQTLFHITQEFEKNSTTIDGEQLALLHQKMEEADAYTAKSRAAKLLSGLGFLENQLNNKVSSFSGGWQMRLNIAKALMCRSDILLLDEPTNHLDLEAVEWLESYLKNYTGTLILISHDRDFLDNIVDRILHIDNQKLYLYNGNFSSFEKQQAEKLLLQKSQHEKQQKKIKHMEQFITRFKAKASKAKQAQSRVKALSRLERILPTQTASDFQIHFFESTNAPHDLLSLHNVALGYNNRAIVEHVNLKLFCGDKIGILGINGAGKSTLIKAIANEIGCLSGEIMRNQNLQVAYFNQNLLDQLDLESTPILFLKPLAIGFTDLALRSYLARFKFDETKINQTIGSLSGGEKARLVLSSLIMKKPNLLLLDEPTNHLDMKTRDALNIALQEYAGATILVSHDRYLLNCVCDKFLLVADNSVSEFNGNLIDYRNYRKERELTKLTRPSTNENNLSNKVRRQKAAELRKKLQPIKNQIKSIETKIETLNLSLSNINDKLSDTRFYNSDNNKDELNSLLIEQSSLNKTLTINEEIWLELNSDLESLEQELKAEE